MNFLMMRSNQNAAQDPQQPAQETHAQTTFELKPTTTLEGLIAEDPFHESMTAESPDSRLDGYGGQNGSGAGPSGKSELQTDNHINITEDEGWIIIPQKDLPDNWYEAPDIRSFRSLDRSFVFPGEQVHVLACLSACKQDVEVITPFKVAAVMNKNGIRSSTKQKNGSIETETNTASQSGEGLADGQDNQNGETQAKGNMDSQKDVIGESLLRMEDHQKQTESLVQRFNGSHYFARIADSSEPLWSKRVAPKASSRLSEIVGETSTEDTSATERTAQRKDSLSATIDRGKFDAVTSGGVARDAVKCCSLPNGDIVVLLQVNVGPEFVRDPILEILQFEKCRDEEEKDFNSRNQDSSQELLKWLLPLDNSIPPPARSSSPPKLSTSASIRTASSKPTFGSSGSQLFSFGHFRSYSMSSLPPNMSPSPPVITAASRPSTDPEDWDRFSFRKLVRNERSGLEGMLSYRGVPLEPERFSVRCGLEGIYTPGRRWRRKIEIIEPIEIHSFAADCNTEDLLCVQIKNVGPGHIPDIVVYVDSIAIVFEEASKGGPPLSLPIACIEAGIDDSLPNLALRRGEEHSFILKPATSLWRNPMGHIDKSSKSSRISSGSAALSWHHPLNTDGKRSDSAADSYAVLVSCRCNYTESKLFFKQPTSWRPRISRDLMISVASKMSRQTLRPDGRVPQLPVQVLTLQASNMTSQDLTLTVLAPASFTAPPSVVSLSSSPSSPVSPFNDSSKLKEKVTGDGQGTTMQRLSSSSLGQGHEAEGGSQSVSLTEPAVPISDVLRRNDFGCTHLWLQSRVPLGCVPANSTATVKLEVLPLTDGIITLDSLQIDVREKGLRYIPENSLKIYATSSIATGIF